MFKKILLAACASVALAGAAGAATLNGVFDVFVVQNTGLDSAESEATLANIIAATGRTGASSDAFQYIGDINFGTSDQSDATTIAQWLASAPGGTVSGLDPTVGGLQQSKPNISNGTATTTFYLFSLLNDVGPGTFMFRHDDGVSVFEDQTLFGSSAAPTVAKDSTFAGFNGGLFEFIYVATNGDPSILKVEADLAPVPLPAALPLLLLGLGGLGVMSRRRKAQV